MGFALFYRHWALNFKVSLYWLIFSHSWVLTIKVKNTHTCIRLSGLGLTIQTIYSLWDECHWRPSRKQLQTSVINQHIISLWLASRPHLVLHQPVYYPHGGWLHQCLLSRRGVASPLPPSPQIRSPNCKSHGHCWDDLRLLLSPHDGSVIHAVSTVCGLIGSCVVFVSKNSFECLTKEMKHMWCVVSCAAKRPISETVVHIFPLLWSKTAAKGQDKTVF